MPTLYEISEEFRSVFSLLEENGGELTPEIAERMGTLETDLELKVDRYCKRIRDLEGDAGKFKAEEERLHQRRESMEKEIKSLKDWLKTNLQSIGRDEVKTGTFAVRIQKSAPAVVVEDEISIPPKFKMASLDMALIELPEELIPKAGIRVNRTLIAKCIKNGEEIPGVRLESSEYLRIR